MWSRLKSEKSGFTLIELIIVIVILGIIGAVAIPKFIGLSGTAKLAAARGVGGALSSTIVSLHANYLIKGTDDSKYSGADLLANTSFSGGITYVTDSIADASGEIAFRPPDNEIMLNYKGDIFRWDYSPQNNETAAYITEVTDSTSNFPAP